MGMTEDLRELETELKAVGHQESEHRQPILLVLAVLRVARAVESLVDEIHQTNDGIMGKIVQMAGEIEGGVDVRSKLPKQEGT